MRGKEGEQTRDIKEVFGELPQELQGQINQFLERHQLSFDLPIVDDLVREVSLMHKLGAKLENIGKVRELYSFPAKPE